MILIKFTQKVTYVETTVEKLDVVYILSRVQPFEERTHAGIAWIARTASPLMDTWKSITMHRFYQPGKTLVQVLWDH